MLSILLIIAIAAPLIVDYEKATKQDIPNRFQPPSKEHFFGTDQYGRDVFARIIHGTRVSLFLGIASIIVSAVIGTTIGALAGYYGGVVANVLMRAMDVLMALPPVLLAVSIVAALGPGLMNLLIAMSIAGIPQLLY